MDPLSIAAASFSIAGAVAKASVAIFEFSRDAKDAAEDLRRVNSELQALTSILDPLARSLSKTTPDGTVSEGLARQLESSLEGCALVLDQLQQLIRKYQREGAWTRTKWVMLGRGDLEKLRESLEAYKMALSLGLHVISMAIEENIQRDTSVLRNDTRVLQEYATDIKINTDEILARVNSIRHGRYNRASSPRVQQWIDEIEILTSYAETTSHGTTVRPEDLDSPENPDEGRGMPVGEVLSEEEHEDSLSDVSPPHAPVETTEMQPKPTSKFRPAGEGGLDLVVAIDIGDTSTAVAWMAHDTRIRIISTWPGGSGTRVPTSVVYDAQGELSSWGFQCADYTHSNPSLTALMDDADNHTSQLSPHGNSRRLADFLRCLYGHIREIISSALGAQQHVWAEMAIEFHFTLPDALRWAGGPSCERLTNTLKRILRGVGIGTARHHYAILGLAATEAASIGALEEKLPPMRDELLVFLGEGCAALLWGNLAVDSLSRGEAYVGSVRCLPRFEDVFAEYILERLRSSPGVKGRLGEGVARELVAGPDFRAVAAAVEGSAPRRARYALRADGIPPSFRHGGLAIADGEMLFTHQQVELVQSGRFKAALDAVEEFIGTFPTLSGVKREGHKISGVKIVSKEATRMTQYIADVLPPALKWKRLGKITASTLGDQASQEAAVRGVLIRRGAWAQKEADIVRVHFVDEYLRLFAWPREPSGLLRPVPSWGHSWKVSATSAGKTIIKFTTEPGYAEKPVSLYFDVFYSFNNDPVSAPGGPRSVGTAGDPDLTRLCTVQTAITENCFKAQVCRDKWYRSGKTFYEVFVTLGPFVTKKERAGPEATIRAGGVRCETDVTWYSEPPQIVWQREYAPPPA